MVEPFSTIFEEILFGNGRLCERTSGFLKNRNDLCFFSSERKIRDCREWPQDREVKESNNDSAVDSRAFKYQHLLSHSLERTTHQQDIDQSQRDQQPITDQTQFPTYRSTQTISPSTDHHSSTDTNTTFSTQEWNHSMKELLD